MPSGLEFSYINQKGHAAMKIENNINGGQPCKITMCKPADLHQHFRQGNRLKMIVPLVEQRFDTALAMPNLEPPLITYKDMIEYGKSIAEECNTSMRVLLTLYLTDNLDPKEVELACQSPFFAGIKYYPAGLTTNSDSGVKNPADLWTVGTKPYQCLQILAEHGKVLLLHGADGLARGNVKVRTRQYKNGEELDPYDQEPHFISESLPEIIDKHHKLKISFEHLSTAEGVEFLRKHGSPWLGCGLTSQHLLIDRRDTHRRGLRPHFFWFPTPQALEHRQELNKFAAEGHSFAYLGSDSAPHYRKKKEADCCAGGVLTAHAGIELYAEAFEKAGCLNKLEAFASINGPKFYGFPPSIERITLVREPWKVTEMFSVEEVVDDVKIDEPVVPFRLGETIDWKLVG